MQVVVLIQMKNPVLVFARKKAGFKDLLASTVDEAKSALWNSQAWT